MLLCRHDDVPTRTEIMTYFEDKIVKAVKMWQRSDGEAVHSNVVNDFMKEVSDNLTLRLWTADHNICCRSLDNAWYH